MSSYQGSNSKINVLSQSLLQKIIIPRQSDNKISKDTVKLWDELRKKDPTGQYFILPQKDSILYNEDNDLVSYRMVNFPGKNLLQFYIDLSLSSLQDADKILGDRSRQDLQQQALKLQKQRYILLRKMLQHIPKFLQAIITMNKVGFHNDLNLTNILYNPTNGFRIIDFDTFKKEPRTQTIHNEEKGVDFVLGILKKIYRPDLTPNDIDTMMSVQSLHDVQQWNQEIKPQLLQKLRIRQQKALLLSQAKQYQSQQSQSLIIKTPSPPQRRNSIMAALMAVATLIGSAIAGVVIYRDIHHKSGRTVIQ